MSKRGVSIALAAVVAIISYIIYLSGITSPVTLERRDFQRIKIAYLTFRGPYSQSWKLGIEVESKLSDVKVMDWSKEPCIGIYYDNPEQVPLAECRSIYGKIIPDDFPEVDGVSTTYIEAMPDTIQVRYPFRGFLSILFGMRKAYPMIHAFWRNTEETKGTAIAELYGFNGTFITYLQGVGEYTGIMAEWPEGK